MKNNEMGLTRIYRKDFKRDVGDPRWVAEINAAEIHFEVIICINGEWNPCGRHIDPAHDIANNNFIPAQRQLKVLYNATGYIPQYGDGIPAEYKAENGAILEREFFVIGKGLFVDEYQEIKLYVTPADIYLEKHT